tara:strand:+ start:508 stop:783 length:276 start_codon:yes stop_codon:yes gene_type:complete
MKTKDGYIIPVPLSEYVETMEDWELVEYASMYEVTSIYCRNGASDAKMKEVNRVWQKRYPDEDIPILECVPPLDRNLPPEIYLDDEKDSEK